MANWTGSQEGEDHSESQSDRIAGWSGFTGWPGLGAVILLILKIL